MNEITDPRLRQHLKVYKGNSIALRASQWPRGRVASGTQTQNELLQQKHPNLKLDKRAPIIVLEEPPPPEPKLAVVAAKIPITAIVPLRDQDPRSTQSRNSIRNNVTSPMSQAQDSQKSIASKDASQPSHYKKLEVVDIN